MTFYDMCSVNDFILVLFDDTCIDWGTIFDEDIPENQIKEIPMAAV